MQKTAENKVSPLFLENPFEKQLNNLEQTHHQSQHETKLDKMFKPKKFEERWRFCNNVAIIVGYVCNYYSSITAFSLIFYLFFLSLSPLLGSFFGGLLALLPSIIIVGAIEFVKRHTSANFLQDLIQFKKFSFGMLAFLVACCSFSIATSFFGAKELPKHFSSPEPIHLNSLYSLDSVINLESLSFDSEILSQVSRMDSFKRSNTNSKGSIRYGAIKPYGRLQKELTEIKTEKRSSLKELKEQYKLDKQEAITQDKTENETEQKEKANLSIMFGISAILSELLFFLCMIGHWWFSWKAQKERYLDAPEETMESVQLVTDDSSNDNRQIEPSKENSRIGFKQSENNEDDNSNDNRQDGLPTCQNKDDNSNDNRQSTLPTCQNPNCRSSYMPRHKKQKFCKDDCRKEAWRIKNKKELIPKSKS